MSELGKGIMVISSIVISVFVFIVFCMWSLPIYNVWQKSLKGQAELKRAEWNRQIAIKEAVAKKEAAVSLAAAEVERARGVAQANKIIGDSLKDNESYLRYLWIMGLQDGSSEVIYVPTEAQLPILEATRNIIK